MKGKVARSEGECFQNERTFPFYRRSRLSLNIGESLFCVKGDGNVCIVAGSTMNSNNFTHLIYQTIVTTSNALLTALESVAAQCSIDEAQGRLSILLQESSLALNEPLDYARLYALLKKDLSKLELSYEDFSGMTLDNFNFSGAILDYANFAEASLNRANLSDCLLTDASFARASCREVTANRAALLRASLISTNWSKATCRGAAMAHIDASEAVFDCTELDHADLFGAMLQRASFFNASLSYCNLEAVSLEGADLRGCNCATASFSQTLQFDANTKIDVNNHTLISMVLVTCARTVEQRKFALYIRYQTGLCWPGFTRLLLRQRELAPWVQETMRAVLSLEGAMEEYKGQFQRWLEGDQDLSLDDIHPLLHRLVNSEIERHAFLPRPDLYWYLQGVLEMAYRQPAMDLNEEQKRIVRARLQTFTNIPGE